MKIGIGANQFPAVLFSKRPYKKFAGWLVKKSPVHDMNFDEMSSTTWLLVDEKRAIFEISKLLNSDHKDTMEETLRRVVTFFRYLANKGWITIKESKSEE